MSDTTKLNTAQIHARISNVLNRLFRHDIDRNAAQHELFMLYIESALDVDTKAALNASVKALYFDDNSDYGAYHYTVICKLTGTKIDDIDEKYIESLFDQLNPK